MRRLISIAVSVSWVVAIAAALVHAQAPAGAATPRIWEGVFTTAQADRGRTVFTNSCIRCHGGDLAGTTAPALKGDRFFATWGGDSVEKLFVKIRDTMPPQFGTAIIDDASKVDIVAYILQTNGFPAGARELAVASGDMAALTILRKGEQTVVQNFALVQTVGCLTRDATGRWRLTSTAEPAVTRDDFPDERALAAAATRPLGTGSYLLLSVAPFTPDAHAGTKVEARGLIYRDQGDARITLTSLKPVSQTCAR